ncbi:MAG: hypothetical protein DRI28_00220 [Caldiserica bacterium]|nr:MAG: hypothetical protein DRI28_00220 [Caldisericota bacterium]
MIEKTLTNLGYRMSKGRREIISFLKKNRGKHLSAEDIYKALKKKGVSLTTVYRTLKILERAGIVKKSTFSKRHMSYELSYKPHIHLICSDCGKIEEIKGVPPEKLMKLVGIESSEEDFTPVSYIVEIYGICKSCRLKLKRTKR